VVTITYIAHNGTTTEVSAEIGSTVMQAAVDNGVDGIVAECGGNCSCATCHCYVDEAWRGVVGEANPIEKGLLPFAIDPRDNSRLGCQIEITEHMDGLVLHLPEAQF
jgi:ferredoxin, 2Fe-2S